MNVKNEYTCKRCNNKDIIEFEGFAPLHYIKCSVCGLQSELSKANVEEKADFIFTFWSKADRIKNKNYKFNPMMKFQHYHIKRVN